MLDNALSYVLVTAPYTYPQTNVRNGETAAHAAARLAKERWGMESGSLQWILFEEKTTSDGIRLSKLVAGDVSPEALRQDKEPGKHETSTRFLRIAACLEDRPAETSEIREFKADLALAKKAAAADRESRYMLTPAWLQKPENATNPK